MPCRIMLGGLARLTAREFIESLLTLATCTPVVTGPDFVEVAPPCPDVARALQQVDPCRPRWGLCSCGGLDCSSARQPNVDRNALSYATSKLTGCGGVCDDKTDRIDPPGLRLEFREYVRVFGARGRTAREAVKAPVLASKLAHVAVGYTRLVAGGRNQPGYWLVLKLPRGYSAGCVNGGCVVKAAWLAARRHYTLVRGDVNLPSWSLSLLVAAYAAEAGERCGGLLLRVYRMNFSRNTSSIVGVEEAPVASLAQALRDTLGGNARLLREALVALYAAAGQSRVAARLLAEYSTRLSLALLTGNGELALSAAREAESLLASNAQDVKKLLEARRPVDIEAVECRCGKGVNVNMIRVGEAVERLRDIAALVAVEAGGLRARHILV